MASNLTSIDPTVKNYAYALSKVEIVNKETELKLYHQYKQNNDIAARNKLVESGLRFVVKVAQNFSKDLDHQKCLISAGNEGLLIAVDRFDPNRGTRFLSYATWWVVLYIREELHRQTVVSVPIWRKKSARKVANVQEKLREKLGREAEISEIQQETGFSQNQIKDVLNDQHQIIPIEQDDAIPSEEDLGTKVMNRSADHMVSYLLSHMPVRERFILQAYYGFITEPPMSLKQIAGILCISSERVRQIKIEALNMLKRSLEGFQITQLDDIY